MQRSTRHIHPTFCPLPLTEIEIKYELCGRLVTNFILLTLSGHFPVVVVIAIACLEVTTLLFLFSSARLLDLKDFKKMDYEAKAKCADAKTAAAENVHLL